MNLRQRLHARRWELLGPVIGLTLFAYFVWHTVQGDRGLIAWYGLSAQVEALSLEHQAVVAMRRELEHRVGLMAPNGLDPDLLDEQVRSVLGYLHPDDIVVVLEPLRAGPGSSSAPIPARPMIERERGSSFLARGMDRPRSGAPSDGTQSDSSRRVADGRPAELFPESSRIHISLRY